MSLRAVRTVAGRAFALSAAGLVVAVLAVSVVVPRLGGATAYTILTGSMKPGMPPGTLVVVRPTPVDQIKAGDVITFQQRSGDPTVVTHRVVSVGVALDGKRQFMTKGDANDAPDLHRVLPEQVRGVRWYAVPYLAYPSLMVDGNIRQLVVMGAVLVLIGYSLASFVGAFRDRRRERSAATAVAGRAETKDPMLTEVGA
jgi:signal peptidase